MEQKEAGSDGATKHKTNGGTETNGKSMSSKTRRERFSALMQVIAFDRNERAVRRVV